MKNKLRILITDNYHFTLWLFSQVSKCSRLLFSKSVFTPMLWYCCFLWAYLRRHNWDGLRNEVKVDLGPNILEVVIRISVLAVVLLAISWVFAMIAYPDVEFARTTIKGETFDKVFLVSFLIGIGMNILTFLKFVYKKEQEHVLETLKTSRQKLKMIV